MNLDALVQEQLDINKRTKTACRREKKQLEEQQRILFSKYSDQFYIVPGDEDDFKQLTGLEVELFNRPGPQKGIVIDLHSDQSYNPLQTPEYTEFLLLNRVTGMINATFTVGRSRAYAYGFPVVLKSTKEPEE